MSEIQPAQPSSTDPPVDLSSPHLYINRELSWLEFNRRVLALALDPSTPLLERVKFLSIFSSNLDEFFMIRVSGLKSQLTSGVIAAPSDGMSPAEQLLEIRARLEPMLAERTRCWLEDVQPGLRQAGIQILRYEELKKKQRKLLRRHFRKEIFPTLTPLAFDPSHPFPHISNLSINLAVVINDPDQGERFARVKVPHSLGRLLRIPSEERADSIERLGLGELSSQNYVWLEEVVEANLDLLFPGNEIVAAYPFRITRDADFEIEEDEAPDLLSAMQEVVGQRHFGSVVRLQIDDQMPPRIRDILVNNLELAEYQVYSTNGRLGLADLMELTRIERPDLKVPPFLPHVSPLFAKEESLFSVLARRDVLLYHPYDSFSPVIDFIRSAASDPDVIAIKQTMYRVGANSPVVEALKEAREAGKQVSVLVELKARFDEEKNIVWARELEDAGVHVAYGLMGLKTHAKMCLVVRRERSGIRCYVHLGTGNYNPVTARAYTDIGLLTADQEIARDVADLFNALTGYSKKTHYRKLLVAPSSMRDLLIEKIEREIQRHREQGGGHLMFKMNSLVDRRCIKALYEASRAGVQVDLSVRGICCLRPGIDGISDTIRVTSVVGRFLEHSRIYYFRNGGDEEVYIGSADLMPRNLDGRVEVLAPVEDPRLKTALRDEILITSIQDNVDSRQLEPDGSYSPVDHTDEPEISSQGIRVIKIGSWHSDDATERVGDHP